MARAPRNGQVSVLWSILNANGRHRQSESQQGTQRKAMTRTSIDQFRTPLREADNVVLPKGTYQGTLGVFLRL
jgi:hypothetical protein